MPLQPTGHAGPGCDRSALVTVTTGAANTMGAWATLITATSVEMSRIRVVPNADIFATTTARGYLADIGVGAAGSEQVIVDDLNWGSSGQGGLRELLCRIPAGSRVSMRGQSVVASVAVAFYATLDARANLRDCPELVTTYGANPAASTGTAVSPGSSSGVWGAWTTIVASTTRPTRWLATSLGISTANQLLATGLVEVATGAVGQEVVIDSLRYRTTASEECNSYMTPAQIDLPAGVRLSARTQQNNVTGAIGVVLHGME